LEQLSGTSGTRALPKAARFQSYLYAANLRDSTLALVEFVAIENRRLVAGFSFLNLV